MATSGTVGTVSFNVAKLSEHAMRRCGRKASDITQEVLESAIDQIMFFQSMLASQGLYLWTIAQTPVGVIPNQLQMPLPVGVIDVDNANYRTLTLLSSGGTAFASSGTASGAFNQTYPFSSPCTQTAINGNIGYLFSSAVAVTQAGIWFNVAGTYDLIFEYSSDGTTYTTALDVSSTSYAAGQFYWYDIATPYDALYFRVRETGGATLNVSQLAFANNPTDIPLSRLNQDDYANLPNKSYSSDGQRALQYWLQHGRTYPTAYLWPVPTNAFDYIVFWTHRYLQDVTAAQQEVEVPQRWWEALVSDLAVRLCLEDPTFEPNRFQILQGLADKALKNAQAEERDNSPEYITPAIAAYTR